MPAAAHKAVILMVAMVGLGIGALVPPLLYREQDVDLPTIALEQLKAEAGRGYPIPPGVMQVIEAQAYGEYPYEVEGTVIYRSLFGMRVAAARSYNNATTYELATMKLLGVWAGFILAEGVLCLLLYKYQFTS